MQNPSYRMLFTKVFYINRIFDSYWSKCVTVLLLCSILWHFLCFVSVIKSPFYFYATFFPFTFSVTVSYVMMIPIRTGDPMLDFIAESLELCCCVEAIADSTIFTSVVLRVSLFSYTSKYNSKTPNNIRKSSLS